MVAVFVMVPIDVVAVAVIVTVPAAIAITSPPELTLATLVSDDVHSTYPVTLKLELSRNLPLAPICFLAPTFMSAVSGATLKAVSGVAAIVTCVEAITPSFFAFIVVLAVPLPLLHAVTIPCSLTLATDVLELFHDAVLLVSTVSPATVVAVAVSCFSSPTTIKTKATARANRRCSPMGRSPRSPSGNRPERPSRKRTNDASYGFPVLQKFWLAIEVTHHLCQITNADAGALCSLSSLIVKSFPSAHDPKSRRIADSGEKMKISF
jgi:hypothetical protein